MKKLTLLYCITVQGCLLGLRDGRIALWEDGKSNPVKVFPYSAAMLPKEDRALLEEGIHFDSKKELIERMEDYLS